jgi:hypothetical protein
MTMALDRHLPVTVIAGLVPAIHAFASGQIKTWMPVTKASEATPFFERLCPGMTSQSRTPLL